jgi:hypothetical protein
LQKLAKKEDNKDFFKVFMGKGEINAGPSSQFSVAKIQVE